MKRFLAWILVLIVAGSISVSVLAATTYKLTLTATTGGVVSGSGTYESGSVVIIKAVPNSGYYFEQWSYDGNGRIDNVYSASAAFVVPNNDAEIQAIFKKGTEPKAYHLTVSKTGNGSVSGSGYYKSGVKASIVATPDAGWEFSGWVFSGDGNLANRSSSSTTFTMPASDSTVTATFVQSDARKYKLTAASTKNGAIYGMGEYPAGALVTIEAMPDRGYQFYRWSVSNAGGTFGDYLSAKTTFVMPASDTQIGATFELARESYKLTVESASGGAIRDDPSGWYYEGDKIEIEVQLNAASTFDRWVTSNGGTFANVSSRTTTFTMPKGSTVVKALMTHTSDDSFSDGSPIDGDKEGDYTLKLTATTGGTVVGGGKFDANTVVPIKAIANEGYHFTGWEMVTGRNVPYSPRLEETTYKMAAEDTEIQAVFAVTGFKMNVTLNIPEAGTVTGGLSGYINKGAIVGLTAKANQGYKFLRWETTTAKLTNSNALVVQFAMPANDVEIQAIFEEWVQATPSPSPTPTPTPTPAPTPTPTPTPTPKPTYKGNGESLAKTHDINLGFWLGLVSLAVALTLFVCTAHRRSHKRQ